MPGQGWIEWKGISGNKYSYEIFPIETEFNAAPGNYVFARETSPGTFSPIYVGETGDTSERFDNHHKMTCITRHGATHITIHKGSSNASVRRAEEQDIKNYYHPPCND